MRTYTLCDIVNKVVGGSIIPIGETDHDNKAFMRMIEIENLTDYLIYDMMRITEIVSPEASVKDARKEAIKWFREIKKTVDHVLAESEDKK